MSVQKSFLTVGWFFETMDIFQGSWTFSSLLPPAPASIFLEATSVTVSPPLSDDKYINTIHKYITTHVAVVDIDERVKRKFKTSYVSINKGHMVPLYYYDYCELLVRELMTHRTERADVGTIITWFRDNDL